MSSNDNDKLRAAILARRAKFMAAALSASGLVSCTTNTGGSDQVATRGGPGADSDWSPTDASVPGTMSSQGVHPSPTACLSIAGPEPTPVSTVSPHPAPTACLGAPAPLPCLVTPPPVNSPVIIEPEPSVCLSIAEPDWPEPEPSVCLSPIEPDWLEPEPVPCLEPPIEPDWLEPEPPEPETPKTDAGAADAGTPPEQDPQPTPTVPPTPCLTIK